MTSIQKNYRFVLAMLFVTALLIAACGGGAKETQKDPNTVKSETENVTLDPDAQIGNETGKWGPDSLETVKNYSLYREFYKQKLYDDALPYWRYVITNAPEARKTPYIDGAKIYEELSEAATDPTVKEAYLDSMFQLYQKRIDVFGEEGFLSGLQAMKVRKYYPEDEDRFYDLVFKAVDIEQEEADYYLLVSYFKQKIKTIEGTNAEKCPKLEEVYSNLADIANFNIDNGHDKADKYEEELEKLDILYNSVSSACEAAKPKDCGQLVTYYKDKLAASPNDLAVVKQAYGKLARNRCKDPMMTDILFKLYQLEPNASRARRIGNHYYNLGDISNAQKYYLESINYETDRTKQAKIYMNLATIERRKSDNLTSATAIQARKYAKQAAELSPGWGKPYLFIGDLYASSGKLCGSGTGWDSQVVAWAATDMWEQAKNIDPSFTSEANKNINRYAQFYPLQSEGFMKGISSGAPYKIGCWIGTTTRTRFR